MRVNCSMFLGFRLAFFYNNLHLVQGRHGNDNSNSTTSGASEGTNEDGNPMPIAEPSCEEAAFSDCSSSSSVMFDVM